MGPQHRDAVGPDVFVALAELINVGYLPSAGSSPP
jgi:hypothetical protein